MYSIELSQISLDEFQEILTSIDLLPGRRILLDHLDDVIQGLKREGIVHLEALQKTLKNKKKYPELAESLSVSVEYLTVLNREINSYVSKPVSLEKLEVFSSAELERLAKAGIKSTQDFYEQCLTKTARQELATRLALPLEKIMAALELSDLLRINGVGPVYAKILQEIGIHNITDCLQTESQVTLDRYQMVNEEKHYSRVNLGLKDVEYCKRFCRKLKAEIEW